jgi:hypothetical protein
MSYSWLNPVFSTPLYSAYLFKPAVVAYSSSVRLSFKKTLDLTLSEWLIGGLKLA